MVAIKDKEKRSINAEEAYKLYVFHRSYFSGKMLAYMRYKEIPHEPIYKTLAEVGGKLMENTGLRQMPVIEAPDGTWMQDTTPMIEWFESRYDQASLFPDHPVAAFFARLLEDYADEWLWRPAIYYRWMFDEDRHMYKTLFVEEFIGGFWTMAKPLTWVGGKLIHKHQDDKFLYGDGMTEKNREHVESIYIRTLDRLEAIFQEQPYLMGERPSFADFGFFGSMFWHFGNDPTPNRIMQERAPGVYEWVARMWNAKASKLGEKPFNIDNSGLPIGCEALLRDACENYLPYLALNAEKYEAGEECFDWNIEGYTYPKVFTSPYRVWCRERLQHHFSALSRTDQSKVKALLQSWNGWEPLMENDHIRSNWDPEGITPMCRPAPISLKHKLLARFTGTNHVRTRRVWVK